MKTASALFSFLLVFCLFGFADASGEQAREAVERGQYIFSVAGGCACHTVRNGMPNAGGREFEIPMAKMYSTNLTADRDTGLGGWSDREIRAALTKGVGRNGEKLLPVMPYEAYSGMSDADLTALVAYLRTLKGVRKETPRLKSRAPFYRAAGTFVWSRFFSRVSSPPPETPQGGVERGRYLVEHVALCGDCHTPRNFIGAPKPALYLAGTKQGPFGASIPNITPDKESGIGRWSRADIADLLLTGTKPDLDRAGGLMAEVIAAGYKKMAREDALAIADYLKTIPPISNKIR